VGDAAETATPAPAPTPVRCVGRRVDAFTWAGKVEIPAMVWDHLAGVKREAEGLGHPVPFDLADLGLLRDALASGEVDAGTARLSFSNRGTGAVYVMLNNDAQIRVDKEAPGGWTVEVIVRAAFLARHTFKQAINLVRRIGAAFGGLNLAAPCNERCRRVDLAADFAGWEIAQKDGDNLVKRQRAALKDFFASKDDAGGDDYEQPISYTYRHDREPTGIAVCPGGCVMVRLYNKQKELAIRGNLEKTAMEREIWTANGWDGSAPVTRLEVQLRTEALKEMRLRRLDGAPPEVVLENLDPDEGERRAIEAFDGDGVRIQWDSRANPLRGAKIVTLCDDLEALAANLDAVWAYATGKWLTLRTPGVDSRLRRCPLDPRWVEAQAVTWIERRSPATRRRKRGGATTAQALGSVLSNLASLGGLPFEVANDRAWPADPAPEDLEKMTQPAAAVWIRAELVAILGAFAERAERDLTTGAKDLRPVVLSLLQRRRAVSARFDEFVGLFWEGG
jgi:hypothetical protein